MTRGATRGPQRCVCIQKSVRRQKVTLYAPYAISWSPVNASTPCARCYLLDLSFCSARSAKDRSEARERDACGGDLLPYSDSQTSSKCRPRNHVQNAHTTSIPCDTGACSLSMLPCSQIPSRGVLKSRFSAGRRSGPGGRGDQPAIHKRGHCTRDIKNRMRQCRFYVRTSNSTTFGCWGWMCTCWGSADTSTAGGGLGSSRRASKMRRP